MSVSDWNDQSFALIQSKRWPEAEAAAHSALALDPESSAGWFNLGRSLLGHGKNDDAVKALQRASALTGAKNADVEYYLGAALEAVGRPSDAATVYRQALSAIGPDAEIAARLTQLEGTAPGAAAAAIELHRGAPELVFRRGETPLPISRRYTNRSGAVLHIDMGEQAGKVTFHADVEGNALFDAQDGTEKLEEVYVSDLVADGPGELVVTTRQDCSLLHFRLFTEENGRWQVVVDQPGLANGILLASQSYQLMVPATGGGYMDNMVQYGSTPLGPDGIRTWVPGWNTHYSTWLPADPLHPLPPIPDCPAR